jgi:hypothetical protein
MNGFSFALERDGGTGLVLHRPARGLCLWYFLALLATAWRRVDSVRTPRALVAKRGDVRIREKEGFKCPWF